MVDELTCFGSDRRFCSWWLNQWLVWLYNMHCILRYMLHYAIYYNMDSISHESLAGRAEMT
jgi:hypothetical protein